ncbi:MAG: nucleotidyltransferase family protein [Synergistaceae bacterium]|jgi:predicted nucleotidyltransferase|nr:nucleotidyltransferase family protein [Synergistaceae bacterium]
MKIPIVGIIAEYNPLHNGHLYQIQKAKESSKAEAVVVVLSSNFVQRGEPSILDKWNRAQITINTGADLVLELPVVFSAHNAGVFASAATDILGSSGIVTHLSFGLEDPDWNTDIILSILNEEPADFKSLLKLSLGKGLSYVEARATALETMIAGSSEKLKKPNNSLALSYMLRLRQKKWKMQPIPIKRLGGGHHCNVLGEYSSSSAIRKAIAEGRSDEAMSFLPTESKEILRSAIADGDACIEYKKLWNLLRMLLIRSSAEEISKIAEVGEGIEYRLKKEALTSTSFNEWAEKCSSKRYTLGRIRRHAIHALIGLNHWENRAFQRIGPAYIRVLATNDKGKELLKKMKETSLLPVVTKYGEASRVSPYAQKMINYELLACELWSQLIPSEKFGEEHKRRIILKSE